MGQREDASKPAAWRSMLGDGKWRYQPERSHGDNTHPVYEMTAEDSAALNRIPQ
jgi:hypothetical protein